MDAVTGASVEVLLPGAPEVAAAYIHLANLWFDGELARRALTRDDLQDAPARAARTAIAAKALAYQAATGAVFALNAAGAAQVIESIKVPDEIEVKYRASMTAGEGLALAREDWHTLADAFLLLALPAQRRRAGIVGTSR